jgi:hypothetical protein
MTDPFAPIDGAKSRAQHCYDLVLGLEPGDQIPYSEVVDLLECSRTAAYAAMRLAAEKLEKNKQQSVETQKSFGWVVIGRDAAMLNKAQKRRTKAARANNRTAGTTLAIDRDKLSRFEQQERDQLVQNVAKVGEIQSRKTKSLAEIAREAEKGRREIPEQRVRQLPDRRQRESA